jgi:ABC-type hemin transport system ATPase subunit
MHLSISDARKSFGRVQALRGVDLDIPSGGRVALVGPNGSGKSTLIRALLGLVECEGRVRLDGRSPWEDRVALARRLAYVPQLAPSLGATVAEVVALVTATRGLSAGAVARVAAELELDVAEVARRPFRNLSGGMKQKLLLALALAARPCAAGARRAHRQPRRAGPRAVPRPVRAARRPRSRCCCARTAATSWSTSPTAWWSWRRAASSRTRRASPRR